VSVITTIAPKDLWQLMQSGCITDLIDVRTPAEYGSVHAAPARHVPLDRLDPRAIMASRQPSADTLYVICKSGGRSAQACDRFHAAGFTNVVSVEGGTTAWEKSGLPVVRGRSALPLDRQVQLVAGLIALSGTLLGTFLNPWFYLLPAMVGCGLTMAGLTGFCPMAILLARMPWNQRYAGATSCCAAPATQDAPRATAA
jgi:rhodanese-related sulfurtransferase